MRNIWEQWWQAEWAIEGCVNTEEGMEEPRNVIPSTMGLATNPEEAFLTLRMSVSSILRSARLR